MMPTAEVDQQLERGPEAKFAGVRGLFSQWANFGVIGVVAGLLTYFIVWGMPRMQSDFHALIERERDASRAEIAKERQTSREEADASRKHGDKAAETIRKAIDASGEKIDARHKEMIEVLRRIESKGMIP